MTWNWLWNRGAQQPSLGLTWEQNGALVERALEGALEEQALEGVLEERVLEGDLEERALEGAPEWIRELGPPRG